MLKKHIRILVVDPTGRAYTRIRNLLAMCGFFEYDVRHAVSAEDVSRLMERARYDCYFVDSQAALQGALGRLSKRDGASTGSLPITFITHSAEMRDDATRGCDPRVVHFMNLTLPMVLICISNAMRRANAAGKSPAPGARAVCQHVAS